MRHTWLLQALASQFHVTKLVFRYNYGNVTKFDPSDMAHHIECQLRPRNSCATSTIVYIGPYASLEEAQADMEFVKREQD